MNSLLIYLDQNLYKLVRWSSTWWWFFVHLIVFILENPKSNLYQRSQKKCLPKLFSTWVCFWSAKITELVCAKIWRCAGSVHVGPIGLTAIFSEGTSLLRFFNFHFGIAGETWNTSLWWTLFLPTLQKGKPTRDLYKNWSDTFSISVWRWFRIYVI